MYSVKVCFFETMETKRIYKVKINQKDFFKNIFFRIKILHRVRKTNV